jgi:hypothetical protein
MQMIAAIEGRKQAVRMRGVADHGVEIDHRIEVAQLTTHVCGADCGRWASALAPINIRKIAGRKKIADLRVIDLPDRLPSLPK